MTLPAKLVAKPYSVPIYYQWLGLVAASVLHIEKNVIIGFHPSLELAEVWAETMNARTDLYPLLDKMADDAIAALRQREARVREAAGLQTVMSESAKKVQQDAQSVGQTWPLQAGQAPGFSPPPDARAAQPNAKPQQQPAPPAPSDAAPTSPSLAGSSAGGGAEGNPQAARTGGWYDFAQKSMQMQMFKQYLDRNPDAQEDFDEFNRRQDVPDDETPPSGPLNEPTDPQT